MSNYNTCLPVIRLIYCIGKAHDRMSEMADVTNKTGKSSQKHVEPLRGTAGAKTSVETTAGDLNSLRDLNSRAMPESLAAEAAVLGSMVIDPVCIGHVVEILNRDAFYRIEHQLVYDAIIALYEKNRGEGKKRQSEAQG